MEIYTQSNQSKPFQYNGDNDFEYELNQANYSNTNNMNDQLFGLISLFFDETLGFGLGDDGDLPRLKRDYSSGQFYISTRETQDYLENANTGNEDDYKKAIEDLLIHLNIGEIPNDFIYYLAGMSPEDIVKTLGEDDGNAIFQSEAYRALENFNTKDLPKLRFNPRYGRYGQYYLSSRETRNYLSDEKEKGEIEYIGAIEAILDHLKIGQIPTEFVYYLSNMSPNEVVKLLGGNDIAIYQSEAYNAAMRFRP